jgi:hypothetical protein
MLKRVFALFTLTLGWVGCSDPPEPSYGPPGGYGSNCWPNRSCSCFRGYSSVQVCPTPDVLTDPGYCDCDATCTPFEPQPAPEIVACGGEPFGVWSLKGAGRGSINLNSGSFTITDANGTTVGGCKVDAVASDDSELLIRIGDGVADIRTTKWNLKNRFQSNCGSDYGNVCPATGPASIARCSDTVTENCCTAQPCGVCECNTSSSSSYSGAWSRSGDTISLPRFPPGSQYCVRSGKLTIRAVNVAVLNLVPVQLSGTPQRCQERTAKDCPKGGACYQGACVGNGNCSPAKTTTECTSIQNCRWDSTTCFGQAPLTCSFDDYGTTPGCLIR